LLSKREKVEKTHFYQFIEPYQIFLVIVVSRSEMIDQLLAQIIQFVALVFGFLMLVNVVISYRFVNQLLSPVKEILYTINQISLGNFVKLQDSTRKDEVGELTRSLNKAIKGLESATLFAADIGRQKYDTDFEPLSKDDKLGNALLAMRDALKTNAEQEMQRRMMSEALANFSDLIRHAGSDLNILCQQTLPELVRFLHAQQGCLYLAENDQSTQQIYLSVIATFAYGRHKFRQERIKPEDNLAGQVYLEKQSLRVDNLPPNYFSIASGLGSIPPSYLMIVPIIL
jgi:nitrate/nitrite-specific signal transduction histidine kinase